MNPGAAPRHVAIMAWDPAGEGNDPGILARLAEIEYGAHAVLYPAPGGDHSALALLLSALTDPRFPSAGDLPARRRAVVVAPGRSATGRAAAVPVQWVPTAEPVEHFTGRTEELARLDRWAADPLVALVGVTAWGGSGKTALVTHWVQEVGGLARRPGLRGVFGWSFYADPSAEHWAKGLLKWARKELGIEVTGPRRLAAKVLALSRKAPLLLVLDGLEVAQEGPAGGGFGRLLDGTLREMLAGVCQRPHGGLVILTSRFPFADLETFDGSSARLLDMPPFSLAEGAALLATADGGWLDEGERRALVAAVDGHALATGVLAGLLAARLPASDLAALHAELAAATRTDARVGKVLAFYAEKLTEADRYLLAAVSLFARPTEAPAVLAVSAHPVFGGRLAGWTPRMVESAIRDRLSGLASWYRNGTVSAHPLVRDTFRPLVMEAAETATEAELAAVPARVVGSRADALRVVEAIELLLDGGHWQPAADLYRDRSDLGYVWRRLSAVRLGQRAAAAFVATPARRTACAAHLPASALGDYLNEAGLFALLAGDLASAEEYLPLAVSHARDTGNRPGLGRIWRNLDECLGYRGQLSLAREAAAEAVRCAGSAEDPIEETSHACAHAAWLAGLAGDSPQAELQFTYADQLEFGGYVVGDHLYTGEGIWYAEWLVRTGRPGPAQALTLANAERCRRNSWKEDVARCERMLGRLALAAGNAAKAGKHLAKAAAFFRDGDYLIELAETLVGLADHARAVGDLDGANHHATEAITIAAARGLVPTQSAALAARAQLDAVQGTTSPALLGQGRDAADAALRVAVRHQLAWHELDALRAHAALDHAEGTDRGWANQAEALHARLVLPWFDPDPLAKIQRQAEARLRSERVPADLKKKKRRK